MRRLFLALLLISACSESEPRTSDAGPRPRPDASMRPDAGLRDAEVPDTGPSQGLALITETYCAPLAQAMCAQAQQCACDALPSWPDTAACEARAEAMCSETFEGLESGLMSGMFKTSQAALQSCLQRTLQSQGPCENLQARRRLLLCLDLIYENVALGEACNFPLCAGGTGECLDSICVPVPTNGQACRNLCAPDLVCRQGSCVVARPRMGLCDTDLHCEGALRCVDSVCTELGAAGASCATEETCQVGLQCTGGQCQPVAAMGCQDSDDCGHQGACVTSVSRICRSTVAQGIACSTDSMCSGTDYCDDAAEVCTPAPADGQPCGNGTRCAAGSGCGFMTGQCAPLPTDGQPCALAVTGPFLCADGLGCSAGVCGALPGLDERCTVDNRCADDLGCDFAAESRCAPRRSSGGCMSDHICEDGLFCDLSALECTGVRDSGESCADGNECGPQGACIPDEARNFTCRPLPGPAEPCFFSCDAGAYCGPSSDESYCLPPICALRP